MQICPNPKFTMYQLIAVAITKDTNNNDRGNVKKITETIQIVNVINYVSNRLTYIILDS